MGENGMKAIVRQQPGTQETVEVDTSRWQGIDEFADFQDDIRHALTMFAIFRGVKAGALELDEEAAAFYEQQPEVQRICALFHPQALARDGKMPPVCQFQHELAERDGVLIAFPGREVG